MNSETTILSVTTRSVEGARFAQVIEAGEHRLTVDRPVILGGDGLGPGPYSYLLAALGACIGITLRMYAERKRIVMKDLQIVLSHRAGSTKAKTGSKTGEDETDLIQARISIGGELNDADRERLMQVATRCWMHRTLSRGVRIQLSQGMAEDAGLSQPTLRPF